MDNIFFDLKRLKYLGTGAIIGKTVRIRNPEECMIGDYTIIDDFTYISCVLEVGRYCHIAPNVTISGGQGKVTMGDFVGVSAGCTIHAASSDYLKASFEMPSIPKEYHVGGVCESIVMADHVLLGSNTVVLPGANLPVGFATAAHTIVHKRDYEPWTLYSEERKPLKRRHQAAVEQAARLLAERHGEVKKGTE